MQRIYVYAFYDLAAKLQPLSRLNRTDPPTYGDVFLDLSGARDAVRQLLANDILAVRTCRTMAESLINAITAVVPDDWGEAVKGDQKVPLSWYQLYRISDSLRKFETVLAEELRLAETFSVGQKGAYSTSELIDAAETLFPDSIRKGLSDLTRAEMRQAGRCFAFETATAAAFHIFRAIESVMTDYYKLVTGKPKPTKMRNWFVYIDAMKKSGKADDKVVALLDHVRRSYRNPVTHPDQTLTPDETQILLGVAVSLISLMVQALAKPHARPAATALPQPPAVESSVLAPLAEASAESSVLLPTPVTPSLKS